MTERGHYEYYLSENAGDVIYMIRSSDGSPERTSIEASLADVYSVPEHDDADDAGAHWETRGWGFARPLFEATRKTAKLPTIPAPRSEHPRSVGQMTVGAALWRRSAAAKFEPPRELPFPELDHLVSVVDCERRHQWRQEAGPFSGMELFSIVYAVRGLASGVYKIGVEGEWDCRATADSLVLRSTMRKALMGQAAPDSAAVSLIYVLDVARQQAFMPGDRGFIDAYIDCGRLAQRLVLSGTATKLRTHQTPAMRDPIVEDLIGLSTSRSHLLYCITLG